MNFEVKSATILLIGRDGRGGGNEKGRQATLSDAEIRGHEERSICASERKKLGILDPIARGTTPRGLSRLSGSRYPEHHG